MLVVPLNASDGAILALVERWAGALAVGDYTAAAGLLTSAGNEREWSPTMVEEVITGYVPGPTPPATAYREVRRWPEPRARPDMVGTVEYDLTINGVLSDLTAIFWLRRVPDGLALELYDIHIL